MKNPLNNAINGEDSVAAKFELKSNTKGQFSFNLKAGNGQVILTSETYESRSAAENGIAAVRNNAASAERFERKISKSNEPYFVLKASNGQVIGRSEMYSAAAAMENGIAAVMKSAPGADLDASGITA